MPSTARPSTFWSDRDHFEKEGRFSSIQAMDHKIRIKGSDLKNSQSECVFSFIMCSAVLQSLRHAHQQRCGQTKRRNNLVGRKWPTHYILNSWNPVLDKVTETWSSSIDNFYGDDVSD
ncbi:hypothetical protein T02_7223 [Trichinella nativa]|uniref:Uncharacterized protein n=1 Tax=Trichinella nativa TaxID=6335 RepID=A0A0V1KSH0_9BILA|nr:hypothetical protein T02_7223 [Trichinella nativa]